MVEPPNKHVNTILQESKNGETILFWHGVNLLFSLDYRVRKEAGGIVFISGGEEGGKGDKWKEVVAEKLRVEFNLGQKMIRER